MSNVLGGKKREEKKMFCVGFKYIHIKRHMNTPVPEIEKREIFVPFFCKCKITKNLGTHLYLPH